MTRPLEGIRVLDFSTLLPGPMATLMLAEAGAEVIKIERPGRGDEMRSYYPRWGESSINFTLLNRGKRSLAIDLKDPSARDRLRPLIETSHIVVEQFRPGVMNRLGLGWDDLKAINHRLVYCAITGYGQDGPKAQIAAHDLNYMADVGLLDLAAGADGAPMPPPVLTADIGGGALPAVLNILLALRKAELTGEGSFLDIAMCDNLFAWGYWAIGNLTVEGRTPVPGGELVTGGSPRYRIYRTADHRFLAAAPLEQKFWERFCYLIGLPTELRDDSRDRDATTRAVAALIAGQPASHWQKIFDGEDVCCNVVRNIGDALSDPHFRARGIFDSRVAGKQGQLPALPVPLARTMAGGPDTRESPPLGEANSQLLKDGE